MNEILDIAISILSGIAIPIILFSFTHYQNKVTKTKLFIDTHKDFDRFIKDMDADLASRNGFKYDIKNIEYLILSGRKFLKPIRNYIKKCYKKNKIPDKQIIKDQIKYIRENHCYIYTYGYINHKE